VSDPLAHRDPPCARLRLEDGERQAKVVEPMAEWLPAMVMPSLLMSEVGKAEPARWMLLSEDSILLGACTARRARMRRSVKVGTISLSHIPASGSGRRGAFFWMAARIGFNAIGSCNAEPGLCRSGGR